MAEGAKDAAACPEMDHDNRSELNSYMSRFLLADDHL
jgi:hypothetical protein